MRSGGVNCLGCGALRRNADARYCEYCGAAYPAPTPPPAPAPVVVVAREPIGMQSSLRVLRASGAAERLLSKAPDSAHARNDVRRARWPQSTFVQIAVAVVAIGLLVKCVRGFADPRIYFISDPSDAFEPSGSGLAAFLPFAVLIVVLIVLVRVVYPLVRDPRDTTRLEPALAGVSDKRTEVNSSRHDTSTEYYVTLEFEDETRHEFAVDSDLYARLRSGDVGAAWWVAGSDDYLVEFERAAAAVEVPADAAR